MTREGLVVKKTTKTVVKKQQKRALNSKK